MQTQPPRFPPESPQDLGTPPFAYPGRDTIHIHTKAFVGPPLTKQRSSRLPHPLHASAAEQRLSVGDILVVVDRNLGLARSLEEVPHTPGEGTCTRQAKHIKAPSLLANKDGL